MGKHPEEESEDIIDTEVYEETEDEEATSSFNQKLKDLREKLKASEQEKMQAMEEMQRAKADFLNGKKRVEEQLWRDKERQTEMFITSLLPLCDSFTMARNNKAQWDALDEQWRKGMDGVFQQLTQLLETYDVVTIDPLHAHFDPNEHEALGTEASEELESDHVLRVIQPGYKRLDTVIRPAKVIITQ